MNKFLIVGANFLNKGAQSMLFITTDELKKHYSNCEVYFGANNEQYDEDLYTFKRVRYTVLTQRFALPQRLPLFSVAWRCFKDFVKIAGRRILLHDQRKFEGYLDLRNLMPSLTAIIDVSGYALADFSSEIEHEYYLNTIRLGKRYNVPVILMPQSFGPFNYKKEKAYLLNEIQKLIKYPALIYARESEGKKYIEEYFSASNVKQSTDLVLQNQGVLKSNIYRRERVISTPALIGAKNVAVIPNYHCFLKGDEERVIGIYSKIIKQLTDKGYNVYIFRHSSQDLEVCRKIAAPFKDESSVVLLTNEFDCLEFDDFVRKFSFIICSRYHGCVHALRNIVPCVILGWAVKYRELANVVNQDDYIFDITNKTLNENDVLEAVNTLDVKLEDERKTIQKSLKEIQNNNCFKEVFGVLDASV